MILRPVVSQVSFAPNRRGREPILNRLEAPLVCFGWFSKLCWCIPSGFLDPIGAILPSGGADGVSFLLLPCRGYVVRVCRDGVNGTDEGDFSFFVVCLRGFKLMARG